MDFTMLKIYTLMAEGSLTLSADRPPPGSG